LPFALRAGKTSASRGISYVALASSQVSGGRHVETAQGATKKKRRMVNSYVYEDTRERLKIIAAFKGLSLFDVMETILGDYIRGWEKLHKVDIEKMRDTEGKPPRKSRAKT
jgi:hypothetical protein